MVRAAADRFEPHLRPVPPQVRCQKAQQLETSIVVFMDSLWRYPEWSNDMQGDLRPKEGTYAGDF